MPGHASHDGGETVLSRLRESFDRPVTGLGRTAREYDFARLRAHQIRHLEPRLLNRFGRIPSERMVPTRRRSHTLHQGTLAFLKTRADLFA